jgi:hypothetical protein
MATISFGLAGSPGSDAIIAPLDALRLDSAAHCRARRSLRPNGAVALSPTKAQAPLKSNNQSSRGFVRLQYSALRMDAILGLWHST